MPTIAHVSDLHLQSKVPARQAQVEPILKAINERKPDLVVISGDVTDDGWDSIDELKWAKDWLSERINGDWFAVPGNHDVGNFVTLPEGQINAERVKRWNECFGSSNGRDIGKGWLVYGINSMLFGSELEAEQLQAKWVHETLVTIDLFSAKVSLFLHSPLCIDVDPQPASRDVEYWLGPRQPRINFLQNIDQIKKSVLIGSGHVHQTMLTGSDYQQIAWAPPASGTWVHAPGLPNPPMPEKTGFFLHTLHEDGRVETELVECAPMLKCIEFDPWP